MYYHFRPITRALECPETLGELHVHLALKMLVTEWYMNHHGTMFSVHLCGGGLEGWSVQAPARAVHDDNAFLMIDVPFQLFPPRFTGKAASSNHRLDGSEVCLFSKAAWTSSPQARVRRHADGRSTEPGSLPPLPRSCRPPRTERLF